MKICIKLKDLDDFLDFLDASTFWHEIESGKEFSDSEHDAGVGC